MPGEKIEAKVTRSLFSFAIGKIEIRFPGLSGRDGSPRPSKHDWHLELAKEVMPVPCHDQLEWIVNNSDVHAECLEMACKRKALICREGRLALGAALPDYLLSLFGILVLFGFGGYAGWLWFLHQYAAGTQLLLFACMAASSLAVWHLQHRFIYPHHVARHALKALGNHGKNRRSRAATKGQK